MHLRFLRLRLPPCTVVSENTECMSEESGVDRLVLQFGNLRVTVESVAPGEPGQGIHLQASGSQTDTPTGPLAGGQPAAPRSEDSEFLAAHTALQLGALNLGDLRVHLRGIGPCEGWTAEARLARAFRAGLSAALVVEGARRYQCRSPELPLRNRVYICLQCARYPDGFWTTSYTTFIRHCPRERSGVLERGSVSHAFPSRCEASCFLEGAGAGWPTQL